MRVTSGAILLTINAFPYFTLASFHSMCYRYFLEKDDCVTADKNENKRCENPTRQHNPPHTAVLFRPKKHTDQVPITVQVFQQANTNGDNNGQQTQQSATININMRKTLVRRYDTENTTSYTIAGGSGICGNYTVDQPGACLWSGPVNQTGQNPWDAGWLNGAFDKNCGKQLYITRKLQSGENVTVYVPVVDGCSFNENKNETGCFRIAFTNKTFFDLKPTVEEQSRMSMDDLDWNFNNEDGTKKANGPR